MQKNSLCQNQVFLGHVVSVKSECENLVWNVFPLKVDELNKLLENFSKSGQLENANDKAFNIPIPVPNLEENEAARPSIMDPVPCNSPLTKQFEVLKPFIVEFMEHTNQVKMWVKLLIPRIEDGNNFGVDIQNTALYKILVAEVSAFQYYDTIMGYHHDRAEILEYITKYPQIEDYRRAMIDLDEKLWYWVKWVMLEMRNRYAAMYDFMRKNAEKILEPRGTDNLNVY